MRPWRTCDAGGALGIFDVQHLRSSCGTHLIICRIYPDIICFDHIMRAGKKDTKHAPHIHTRCPIYGVQTRSDNAPRCSIIAPPAIGSPTEPDHLVVEPRLGREGDQKLGTIRVRTVVGHSQDPGLVEFYRVRFVAKHFSVDRTATVPRAGEVTPLYPRVSYHAVKGAALVGQPVVAWIWIESR